MKRLYATHKTFPHAHELRRITTGRLGRGEGCRCAIVLGETLRHERDEYARDAAMHCRAVVCWRDVVRRAVACAVRSNNYAVY